MRKVRTVLLLSGLTVLAAAAIVATATALQATKLRVVTHHEHARRIAHGFIVRGQLVDAANRRNRVGRFEATFRPLGHHRVRIRAVAVFDRIGSLKAKGVEGPGDNRLPIIGGTGAFNGAAGKLITRNIRNDHTLLTFVFVQ